MAESGDGVGEVVCSGEFPTGVKMNGVDDNGRPVGISDIDSIQLKIADFNRDGEIDSTEGCSPKNALYSREEHEAC